MRERERERTKYKIVIRLERCMRGNQQTDTAWKKGRDNGTCSVLLPLSPPTVQHSTALPLCTFALWPPQNYKIKPINNL